MPILFIIAFDIPSRYRRTYLKSVLRHMKKSEYSKRRKKLMDMLGDDSIAILPAAP